MHETPRDRATPRKPWTYDVLLHPRPGGLREARPLNSADPLIRIGSDRTVDGREGDVERQQDRRGRRWCPLRPRDLRRVVLLLAAGRRVLGIRLGDLPEGDPLARVHGLRSVQGTRGMTPKARA